MINYCLNYNGIYICAIVVIIIVNMCVRECLISMVILFNISLIFNLMIKIYIY